MNDLPTNPDQTPPEPIELTKKKIRPRKKRNYHPPALNLWQDRQGQGLHIEILPLMDVIFCILTFFILAAVNLSRQQAINLNLPEATSAKAQMREMLMVSVDYEGQIYVEKEPINNQRIFTDLIVDFMERNPRGVVVVHASQDSPYRDVIQVLDLLRNTVGGDKVALATLQGNGGQPQDPFLPLPSDPSNLDLNFELN